MRDYRLYMIDRKGRIARALELDCEGDDDALSKAERERAGLPAELWQRARRIQVFRGPENGTHA